MRRIDFGQKMTKLTQNGPNMAQYGPKTVQNGLKLLFITRIDFGQK